MKNKPIIKSVLLFVSSLTVMAGAIIAPALPEISKYFPGENTELLTKLVLTMPAFIIAIASPFVGILIDRFGRKKLLISSLVIYGLAGVSGYFIDDILVLLGSRAVLGMGVAGIMNTAVTLIGDYFEGDERRSFIGTQASFMAFGGVIYLNLGGWLAEFSWREPFLIYLAAFVFLPFALVYLFEPKISKTTNEKDTGKESAKLSAQIKRVVLANYIIGFLGMVFFYMVPVQIPFLLKAELGTSNALIGLAISVATLTASIASFSFGKIKARLSHSAIFTILFLLMAVGYYIIYFAESYPIFVLAMAIGGFGLGLMMPNSNLCLMNSVPAQFRGRTIGGFTTAVFLGQFMSPIVVAPVVGWSTLHDAFLYASILQIVLGAVVFFFQDFIFGK